jgi:hypothetical protein
MTNGVSQITLDDKEEPPLSIGESLRCQQCALTYRVAHIRVGEKGYFALRLLSSSDVECQAEISSCSGCGRTTGVSLFRPAPTLSQLRAWLAVALAGWETALDEGSSDLDKRRQLIAEIRGMAHLRNP